MTRVGMAMLVCGLGSLALGYTMQAVTQDPGDFPYQRVIDRNAFALKPPPEPVPTEPPPPPPPKITLTGAAKIGGKELALMKVMEPAKPPEPAKEQSYILAVGERQGSVEVLAIDEKAGTVKVNNSGVEMVLQLATNLPPATAPPPAGVPPPMTASAGSVPGMPPSPPAMPGSVAPAGGAPAQTGPPMKTIPTRQLRLPIPSSSTPSAPPTPPSPSAPPALPQATTQQKQLSHEEAVILMEVNRELTKKHVQDGSMPPLPPTELTPSE